MMARVSGLSTRFALALALSAARSLLTSQPIRGRWLGGVGRILPAQRQLLLQIGDLLLRIRDLLFGVAEFLFAFGQLLFAFGQFRLALGQFLLALGQLVTEILNLLLLPLDLPVQFFAAGLFGVPIAIRRRALSSLPAANPCRTHPPYVKRFGAICPAKSTRVLELLPFPVLQQKYPRAHMCCPQ